MTVDPVLTGGCLCSRVKFRVSGRPGVALNCHCSMCRKAHAAAFRSRVAIRKADFVWTSGEEEMRWYESSSTTRRGFCSRCGTRLVSEFSDDVATYGVPIALFDGEPDIRPQFHIYVGSKAPWFQITDDLPQYEEGAPR